MTQRKGTGIDAEHESAVSRYAEASRFVSMDDLPYKPSVWRDLRVEAKSFVHELKGGGKSGFAKWQFAALVAMLFPFILSYGIYQTVYWAVFEKRRWIWSRTDAQDQLARTGTARPPGWHKAWAVAVALALSSVVFLPLFAAWIVLAGMALGGVAQNL